MRRASIFKRIAASHALTLLVATGASGVVYYFLITGFLTRNVERELGQASRVVNNLVGEEIASAALYSKLISENYSVGRAAARGGGAGLSGVLRREMKSVPVDFIAVADASGVVFAHEDREKGEARVLPEPMFLSAAFRECERTGTQAVGVETMYPNTAAVVAVSPIRDESGAVAGYLRTGYKLNDDFARRIRKITGVDVALAHRGRLLASSAGVGGGERDVEFGGTALGEIMRRNVTRAAPLSAGKPEVIVAYPRSRIASVRNTGVLLIAAITVAAFSVSALMSVRIARRIVRPIAELMNGVRRVEAGDLRRRIPTRVDDEIGELTESFNRMTEALVAREEEIREGQKQLIESGKLAAVGELAAGVAHEIGNPLAAISGYVQLLKSGASGKEFSRFLDEIEKEAGYIDGTIRELMDFARPAGSQEEEVEVNETVEEALRMVSFHKAMKNVRIEKDFGDGSAVVRGNRREILQALLNVALNAAQSMPDGGLMRVAVAVGPGGREIPRGSVGITVSDTGTGIRRDDLERIFDPFFTTKRGGTGLGLSITYRIVERHGGKIFVHTDEGKGSRFTIALPLAGGSGTHRAGRVRNSPTVS
ncbi:MAG: ATP-binding protein [bacterium]